MFTIKSISRLFSGSLVTVSMLALMFSAVGVTPARAAGLVVNSLLDTVGVDGNCTLREAIQNANNNAATNADCVAGSGADTITFSVSGAITLGSRLPMIADAAGLTIDGAGQTVTISGNNLVGVMSVNGTASLTLNNLTIANGKTGIYGGGIENYGTLAITNSAFSNNSNSAYDGGGIYNFRGAVTVTNSTFTGNSTAHGGGGIYSLNGSVTITNSTFLGNTAGEGGGIYSYDCTLNITNSFISGNNTPSGRGGGIYSFYGPLTITNSTFSNNGASWGNGGGGIYMDSGALTITHSIFSGNSATGSPGGGIFNASAMDIRDSTFSGNSAGSGGGIFNSYGNSTIANSTFTGNSASGSGVNGGGILNAAPSYGGSLIITNSTFSGNSVPGSGGGIGRTDGAITLRNTIVANSTSGGSCSGAINNGGNNIDDGATCGWDAAKGSMSNTNPLLGALTGSPAYFPLNVASPAINAGDDSICAASPVNNQSQNGVTRPQGAHCDIGSYEKTIVTSTLTLNSIPTQDGWVLESSENSKVGGTMNSNAATFNLGDDAARKQYRGILSFSTGAGLPDNATITGVTLKVKKSAIVGGGNPVVTFKGFMVDIKNGFFGTSAALQTSDFQATASHAAYGPFNPVLTGGWYSINLTAGKDNINKLGSGLTQIRLRFNLDDNNNAIANVLSLYSGNAPAGSRPQLVITYHAP